MGDIDGSEDQRQESDRGRAAKDVGRVIVELLAAEGADIGLCSRSEVDVRHRSRQRGRHGRRRQEVARIVVFLASPAASLMVGSNVVAENGFTKRVQS